MENAFRAYLESLMEKHLPMPFLDYGIMKCLLEKLGEKSSFGRKELLLLAYHIGANPQEGNALLALANHLPLYVKRREDAIWWYMLSHRIDGATIIEEIFPQNVDEIPKSTRYNELITQRKEEKSTVSDPPTQPQKE